MFWANILNKTFPCGQEVFTSFCWFELGLIACGIAAVLARITYVLQSCCFCASHLFCLSWSPICPLFFYPHHPSLCLPPSERTVCGAQRQRKARLTQDLTEKIRGPPAAAEQHLEHTVAPENCETTRSRIYWLTEYCAKDSLELKPFLCLIRLMSCGWFLHLGDSKI